MSHMKLSHSKLLKAIKLPICLEVQFLDTLFKSVGCIGTQPDFLMNSGLAHQDGPFEFCFLVRYLTLIPWEERIISLLLMLCAPLGPFLKLS